MTAQRRKHEVLAIGLVWEVGTPAKENATLGCNLHNDSGRGEYVKGSVLFQ